MRIALVTGAPGSGKSSAVKALKNLKGDFLVFDMDDLLVAASALAAKNVQFEPSTWQAYGRIWFEFLVMVCKNGRLPVLFGPHSKQDVPSLEGVALEWCLLECSDSVRRERLQARKYLDAQITEALEDAKELREQIKFSIDTGRLSKQEVALELKIWLEEQLKAVEG